ncbi:hypothetical protein IWQ60_004400 [Tieghemiomyces parasiticus]|uniref:Uncharacterized protein n=1 Tax=Tieghemiomyces parasiticus TaxID=78921 RepID=A0A9W8A8Y1_9FUNG|nr:hypothetical protein IWQ60_004400 [Tieghemiomyces parasiticus]
MDGLDLVTDPTDTICQVTVDLTALEDSYHRMEAVRTGTPPTATRSLVVDSSGQELPLGSCNLAHGAERQETLAALMVDLNGSTSTGDSPAGSTSMVHSSPRGQNPETCTSRVSSHQIVAEMTPADFSWTGSVLSRGYHLTDVLRDLSTSEPRLSSRSLLVPAPPRTAIRPPGRPIRATLHLPPQCTHKSGMVVYLQDVLNSGRTYQPLTAYLDPDGGFPTPCILLPESRGKSAFKSLEEKNLQPTDPMIYTRQNCYFTPASAQTPVVVPPSHSDWSARTADQRPHRAGPAKHHAAHRGIKRPNAPIPREGATPNQRYRPTSTSSPTAARFTITPPAGNRKTPPTSARHAHLYNSSSTSPARSVYAMAFTAPGPVSPLALRSNRLSAQLRENPRQQSARPDHPSFRAIFGSESDDDDADLDGDQVLAQYVPPPVLFSAETPTSPGSELVAIKEEPIDDTAPTNHVDNLAFEELPDPIAAFYAAPAEPPMATPKSSPVASVTHTAALSRTTPLASTPIAADDPSAPAPAAWVDREVRTFTQLYRDLQAPLRTLPQYFGQVTLSARFGRSLLVNNKRNSFLNEPHGLDELFTILNDHNSIHQKFAHRLPRAPVRALALKLRQLGPPCDVASVVYPELVRQRREEMSRLESANPLAPPPPPPAPLPRCERAHLIEFDVRAMQPRQADSNGYQLVTLVVRMESLTLLRCLSLSSRCSELNVMAPDQLFDANFALRTARPITWITKVARKFTEQLVLRPQENYVAFSDIPNELYVTEVRVLTVSGHALTPSHIALTTNVDVVFRRKLKLPHSHYHAFSHQRSQFHNHQQQAIAPPAPHVQRKVPLRLDPGTSPTMAYAQLELVHREWIHHFAANLTDPGGYGTANDDRNSCANWNEHDILGDPFQRETPHLLDFFRLTKALLNALHDAALQPDKLS